MIFKLLLSLVLCSVTATIPNDTMNTTQEPLTYLALGDSYTIGEAVDIEHRFPVQLVNRLNDAGISVKQPEIIAQTGWTTDELKEAISASDLEETYDLVSLLIGVNNQYRGYPISQYKSEFEGLLETAIRFADHKTDRVFVVSIPDYGVTPFAKASDGDKIAREIDAYNNMARQICLQKGVKYFDITPHSRKAATDPSLIAEDDLHPSGKMYKNWVNTCFQWVFENLSR